MYQMTVTHGKIRLIVEQETMNQNFRLHQP